MQADICPNRKKYEFLIHLCSTFAVNCSLVSSHHLHLRFIPSLLAVPEESIFLFSFLLYQVLGFSATTLKFSKSWLISFFPPTHIFRFFLVQNKMCSHRVNHGQRSHPKNNLSILKSPRIMIVKMLLFIQCTNSRSVDINLI